VAGHAFQYGPAVAIDRARWEQLAARMRTRWPEQLSNIKSEAYFAALSDLDEGELEKGVDALIAGDSDELPTPGEIRAAAQGEPPASGEAASAKAAEPEERKYAGIPASWLLSALVAVVVAAVIVVVFVVVFDDNSSTNAEPVLFESNSIENELIEFDWENGLNAVDAQCEEQNEMLIGCTVMFDGGNEIDVSVAQGPDGELTIDVPDDQQPSGGQSGAGQGGGGGSGGQQPSPESP
jgi:hypothetical protein